MPPDTSTWRIVGHQCFRKFGWRAVDQLPGPGAKGKKHLRDGRTGKQPPSFIAVHPTEMHGTPLRHDAVHPDFRELKMLKGVDQDSLFGGRDKLGSTREPSGDVSVRLAL